MLHPLLATMAKRKHSTKTRKPVGSGRRVDPVGLRIVGGRFRGRKLSYGGDMRVRPMKDRTREAIFNLLGPAVRGMWGVDLFAGTGAMALEAISRGAEGAVMIERHLPTARVIRKNVATVEAESLCTVVTADAFRCKAEDLPALGRPWVIFCCPPYDFFVDRQDEMLELINRMLHLAPSGSAIVVESDERFSHPLLPEPEAWDIRRYAPATIAIRWKE